MGACYDRRTNLARFPVHFNPARQSSNDRIDLASPHSAYLFTQNAGRFSDVYRLNPGRPATLGRSSENAIVVRSDHASRVHAEVFFDSEAGSWAIRDRGSRNGTIVNGCRIESDHRLDDGDEVVISGYAIRFHHQLGVIGLASAASGNAGGNARKTENQVTTEFDPASIAQRIDQSGYLDGLIDASGSADKTRQASHAALLRLSFEIGRGDSVDDALDMALAVIERHTGATAGGIYRFAGAAGHNSDELCATFHAGQSAFRGITPAMRQLVIESEGGSILARNISAGQDETAGANSLGQIDVETVILAVIQSDATETSTDTALKGPYRWGVIHLTTSVNDGPLTADDLQFAVAVAQVLAIRIESLRKNDQLAQTLRRSRRQVAWLKDALGDRVQLIGRSDSIANVIEQVRMVAPTGSTVLIRGESGVGKELIASAIHHASPRADGPLVCMNCAALSASLLESELFGHEKGAFTGATDRKRGKFELAHSGTILLDEIGEMSADIQAKFLRVLEGHPFERVGGHEPIRVDVRVVAATHRDLQAMVAAGDFRQDLYYRLNVVEITVPPLRDRGRDVIMLAEHFLLRFAREMGRPTRELTDAAQKRLLNYPWPGNIRELRNVIERAVVLSQSSVIDGDDLLLTPTSQPGQPTVGETGQSEIPIEQTLAHLERQHIDRVLKYTEGNKSRAAKILGVERSTLDRKLKRYLEEEA